MWLALPVPIILVKYSWTGLGRAVDILEYILSRLDYRNFTLVERFFWISVYFFLVFLDYTVVPVFRIALYIFCLFLLWGLSGGLVAIVIIATDYMKRLLDAL